MTLVNPPNSERELLDRSESHQTCCWAATAKMLIRAFLGMLEGYSRREETNVNTGMGLISTTMVLGKVSASSILNFLRVAGIDNSFF
jgi:hypothetical protein